MDIDYLESLEALMASTSMFLLLLLTRHIAIDVLIVMDVDDDVLKEILTLNYTNIVPYIDVATFTTLHNFQLGSIFHC